MRLDEITNRLGDLGISGLDPAFADIKLKGMEESGIYSFIMITNQLRALERKNLERVEQAIADRESGDGNASATGLHNTILASRTSWLMNNWMDLKASVSNLERYGEEFKKISNLFITMGKHFGHNTKEQIKELTIRRQEEIGKLYDAIAPALRSIGLPKNAEAFANLLSTQETLLSSFGEIGKAASRRTGSRGGALTPEEIEAMQRRDASESGYDDNAELRGGQADAMDALIRDTISRFPVSLQAMARREIADKGNKAVALQMFMKKHGL